MARSRSRRRSRRRRRSCSYGEIRRVAYRTKRGTRVRSSCIKDRGALGRGKKILPKPKKGNLEGYHLDLPAARRHAILRKVANKDGWNTVIRRVNLLRNYNKNNKKNLPKIVADLDYLERNK